MTLVRPNTLHLELDVQFRLATVEDLPKLEWYGQFIHFRRMFKTTYEDQVMGKRLMLLADLNNFPIGHVFILLGQQLRGFSWWSNGKLNNRRGYLYAFRVMEHLQGMGIGTRLLLEAEDLLLQHENSWATISVAKVNERALKLYERHGYKIFADDPGRWQYVNHLGEIVQVHEPCWMLEKQLKVG